jgi:hypothetical protein
MDSFLQFKYIIYIIYASVVGKIRNIEPSVNHHTTTQHHHTTTQQYVLLKKTDDFINRKRRGGGRCFEMFYYESRKRELKTKLIYENRCDERLKN